MQTNEMYKLFKKLKQYKNREQKMFFDEHEEAVLFINL